MSSVGSFESSDGEDISEDFVYINQSDVSSFGSLELEDIQEAILGVKKTILETEVESDARKDLVHKLIRLRIKKEDLENKLFLQPGELESGGHNLVPVGEMRQANRGLYCDQCGGGAWPLLQTLYSCKVCSHLVHHVCLSNISRRCVGAYLANFDDDQQYGYYDGSLLFRICPELSLAEQGYRCSECHVPFTSLGQARLCDYTGHYFCYNCHWGATHPSPARIVHNWDFTPRPVCQAALQYLSMLARKPLVNLGQTNPSLSVVIEEVSQVGRLRRIITSMKKYLMVCRIAQEERLLRRLEERQHFVDGESMYSLQDLLDLDNGVLMTFLETVVETFRCHITSCVLCLAKSFVCEICVDSSGGDTLFPFDEQVDTCADCEAVFHRDCFRSVLNCPRCSRKREKKGKATSTDMSL